MAQEKIFRVEQGYVSSGGARKLLIGFQLQSRIAAATISEENITKKKMSCSKIDRQ